MNKPLQGLDAAAKARYMQARQALLAGRVQDAAALASALHNRYPGVPEVLHLVAGVRGRMGEHAGALAAAQAAVALQPDDANLLCTLGLQLDAAGRGDEALAALDRACTLQPALAMAWYDLGVLQVRAVRFEAAAASLRRVLELEPANERAHLQLADVLETAGDGEAAAGLYREVLAARPTAGEAWWGLARARCGGLGESDIPALQAAVADAQASERERIATAFALARVLDRAGRSTEVMGVLREAHAHAARLFPWDAQAFARELDGIRAAFPAAQAGRPGAALGQGVIFICGLPRSGTTLTEQILASHPQVAGSGELPDLPQVIMEESRRRGAEYPHWIAALAPGDCQRLGEGYLQRIARWRASKPCVTDKWPGNWLHAGLIHALLPAAKIIVCRRDPLETCFACYRHYLPMRGQGWTHRFTDLGAYWNGFDALSAHWLRLFPGAVYEQRYEDLLSDPEASVRALLAFCGLPYAAACLRFHANPRAVRSPSAAQVREPLHATARAARYGALLDPLRRELGLVDILSRP